MIYLITSRASEYDAGELKENGIEIAKGKDFAQWFDVLDGADIQLDTETNVVRDVFGWEREMKGKNNDWSEPILDENGEKIPVERECYVVQIGDFEGKDQWIFDIPGLGGKKMDALKVALASDNQKLIHNALFNYIIIK